MWVTGYYYGSLKMTPFDRLHTTSCQSAIVSIGLYCTVFVIFDVEEYRDLEILVKGHSSCEFMHGR